MNFSKNFVRANEQLCDFEHFVPAPYFRKSFILNSKPRNAEITICGLGFYELYINGEKITKGSLAPYISNPDDILYYDSYNVSEYLKIGENVVGVVLGNGMQNCVGGTVWDFDKARFRSSPKFAFLLCIEYHDGSKYEIDASDFMWKFSPVIMNDLRAGEWYDARDIIKGWNLPGLDDSDWCKVVPAEIPCGEIRFADIEPIITTQKLLPMSIRKSKISIFPKLDESILDIFIPEDESMTEGYLYDFGINAAGVCRLKIKNSFPGQKIILQFGEILGELDEKGKTIRNENSGLDLRGFHFLPHRFNNRDIYICSGEEEEIWMPSFTYHGFRYCLVMGITEEQASDDLLVYNVMNTKLENYAEFKCSDDVINKLWSAGLTSNLANFYHFPTDCPHREKNGWTGDGAVSAEQMIMTLSCEKNLKEWLRNIRKAMRENGELPGIVPTTGWGYGLEPLCNKMGPVWDSVLMYIPYYIWHYRGDTSVIYENADAMLRYINYLDVNRSKRGLIEFGLGDWCQAGRESVADPTTPNVFTSTLIAIDICNKSALMFEKIGRSLQSEFARTLEAELKASARKYLIDEHTMTAVYRTQTAQAMAIHYGLFKKEECKQAVDVLVDIINENNDFIDCGLAGLRVIFHVLSDYGYADLALKMITRPEYPSYGYRIKNGATSLWETFYPIDSAQSSCNHHFFGDILSWFIKGLGGINVNPYDENINSVIISPRFAKTLDFAKATQIMPAGCIKSEWRREDEKINFKIEIPEGTEAEMRLESGWQNEDGFSCFKLNSGINDICVINNNL